MSAEERISAARALHRPFSVWLNTGSGHEEIMCSTCTGESYPCPTVRALTEDIDGDTPPDQIVGTR